MAFSKALKTKVLENFYSLDYLFFGKKITEVKNCCPLIKEDYFNVKGAILSVMLEMYKTVKYNPTINEKELIKKDKIFSNAKSNARIVRESAFKIVKTKNGIKSVKNLIKESMSPKSKLTNSKIRQAILEKTLRIGVDKMLIETMLKESTYISGMNKNEGKIIESAYKTLRNTLVEQAIQVIKSID